MKKILLDDRNLDLIRCALFNYEDALRDARKDHLKKCDCTPDDIKKIESTMKEVESLRWMIVYLSERDIIK